MSHIYIDIAKIDNYTASATNLIDTDFIKEDWMRLTLNRIYYILNNHTYVSDENIENLYYFDENTYEDNVFNQDAFNKNYKQIKYKLQTNRPLYSFKIGDKIYVSSNTDGVVYSYEIFMILWILLIPKGIIILTPPVEIWYEVFNAPPPDSLILQNFISNLLNKHENKFIISIKGNLKLQDNSITTDYDPTYYQERKSFPSLINNAYFKTKTSSIPKKKSDENYKEKYKSFISNPDCMASIFYPYMTQDEDEDDNIKNDKEKIYKSNASMWTNTSFLNKTNYVNNFWKIFKTYKKLDISQDDIDKVYNAILSQQVQGIKNLYGTINNITDNDDLKKFRIIYKLIVTNADENVITNSNIIYYFDPIWNEFVEEYKAARVYLNSNKPKTNRVFKLLDYENSSDQDVYLKISDSLLEKYCTMSGICNQIRIDNDDVFNAFVRIYKKLGGKKAKENLKNNDMFWKDIGEIWSRIVYLKNMK